MGKKKDKAEKKKNKNKKESKTKSPALPEPVEIQPTIKPEPGPEIVESVENTSVDGLIELVKILDQNIELINQSNHELRQEIAQNQQKLQRQNTIYKYVCIALTAGIIVTGYNTAILNLRITEDRGKLSSEMTAQIEAIDTSFESISADINQLSSSVEKLTAQVLAIKQDIDTLQAENNDKNTEPSSKQYNPWSTTHPGQNRSYWR
jgi:outer membrane murein-binding lipoprotein Lpp